jgi:hypothetical protein
LPLGVPKGNSMQNEGVKDIFNEKKCVFSGIVNNVNPQSQENYGKYRTKINR